MRYNKSSSVCLLLLVCHYNKHAIENGRNQTSKQTHPLLHTFQSVLYLSVSIPTPISNAKMYFSSQSAAVLVHDWAYACNACCYCSQLIQQNHSVRMRHTLTLSLFLCVNLCCCFPSFIGSNFSPSTISSSIAPS